MSYTVFKKMPFIRLRPETFHPLRGIKIPPMSSRNSGSVGIYLDTLIKKHLKNPYHANSTVDLVNFGVEIKSKDVDSTSSQWSIGSMRIQDIVNTPYINSTIYLKTRAMLLVERDDKFQVVTDTLLVYMDMDEVQLLLQNTYEHCRKLLTVEWDNYQAQVNEHLRKGDLQAAYAPIVFKPWFSVKGNYGMFEYMSGTSFQFRISSRQMNDLTEIALKTTAFEKHFEFQ